MKKLLIVLLFAVATLSTASAQVLGWNNNTVFSGAKFCFEALPSNGNSADSASVDVCLVRTAANAIKVTGADGSTAAALTASTVTTSSSGSVLIAPVITTGLTASGSASNDFSASTGTFKTSTGAGTFGGSSNTFSGTSPQLDLGVSGSVVGAVKLENATSGSITIQPPTGALGTATITVPALTGSLATGTTCGASLAAAGVCANTSLGANGHFFVGSFLLSGSTSTVTGISPAFTSATSWWCVANDVTTRANPVQAIPGSASTLVITNTTGATDLIQVICAGN